MRRRGKRSAVALSLLAGCGSTTAPEARQDLPIADPRKDPAATALAALGRDALHHDRFARRTLYTWTTQDQIDDLRRTRRLLVRDESPQNGASYLEQVLYLLAQQGDDVAALLYSAGFAKMRFAWHAPWATRNGWPTEQYGDQLIRISLRPDAIIVMLASATGAFEARNLMNELVPRSEVLAHPEHIAAVYFVSDATRLPAGKLPRPSASYREFALCNEAMIESWEVGTERIAQELATNATALEALGRYLETQPAGAQVTPSIAAWSVKMTSRSTPELRPDDAYAAALALDSPNYRLDVANLAALAKVLRATPGARVPDGRVHAIEGTGTTGFALGISRPPPRIVTRVLNTFATYSRRPSPTAAHP